MKRLAWCSREEQRILSTSVKFPELSPVWPLRQETQGEMDEVWAGYANNELDGNLD